MGKLNDKRLIYRDLVEYRIEYYCADKKGKERVENKVRQYIKGVDDSIYLELNNGVASGLFSPASFESDLDRATTIWERDINKETNSEE